MSDLIKREDVVKEFGRVFGDLGLTLFGVGGNDLAQVIANAIPSAERKGEWILESGKIASFWVCSECDFPATVADEINDIKHFNYCPNCGADMRGADDDNA